MYKGISVVYADILNQSFARKEQCYDKESNIARHRHFQL